MQILYFFIAVISTIIGSAAGIGGGVIIKPALDAISNYPLPTVNLLSSATIFVMSIVNVIYQVKNKSKINVKSMLTIAISSIIGGVLGQKIMDILQDSNIKMSVINNAQSIMLIIILLLVFIYMKNKDKIKTYNMKNILLIGLVGLLLGAISAFLGIGGGPINVAVFTVLFSMSASEAARNSIIVIFFSQGSKILSIALTTGFSSYNLQSLPVMLIGGIAGGLIGYRLNKSISEKNIIRIFDTVLVGIVMLNIYNIFR